MGHEHVRTPRLDRLAAESLTFTRGYVPTGLCRPSLASMINGRWPHEHGIIGNDPLAIPGMANRQNPAFQERCRTLIDCIDRYPTLPRLLKPLGYASYQCGKWWEGEPARGGFDEGMTHGDPARGGRHGDEGLKIGREGMAPLFDFIDRHQEQPFLVWYAPFLPHEPHTPPQRLLQRYLDEGIVESQAKYWASVDWFDETCGQLLDHLDERGLSEDTIVVYVTDNGWVQRNPDTVVPQGWRNGFAPRSKQSVYDNGIRTPIMIRWPGKIAPRREETLVASSIDLVPTLLAAVGADAPEGLPGVNLLELEDDAPLAQREAIFGESYLHDVDLENPLSGLLVRWCISGSWKLIVSHDADVSRAAVLHGGREKRIQLFDLLADPQEQTNLAADHPEVIKTLRAKIDAWWSVDQPPVIEQLPEPTSQDKSINQQTQVTRPNVLLIMSDDQGYGDVAFHGNEVIRTPTLDELAKDSFRLTNFHVDPTCSETRSALMTGRYSCRTGVWHTIQGRSLLDPRFPTMANWFADAGYATGIFGKWHLGDAYPLRPQDRGFERSLVHGGGGIGQTPDYWGNTYFNPVLCDNGHWRKFDGYCTKIFADAAIEFIRGSNDRPFFCYLPTNVAHGPYQIDEARKAEVAARGVPAPMAAFYAMIEDFDAEVGRVLDCLEEQGVADNTIVIYMNDNGTAAGVAGENATTMWRGFNAGMRGQKGSPYDGGHRVSSFIRWRAGGIEPGESNRLTAHFDLLPTLAQWCQLSEPAAVPDLPPLDGMSLDGLVRGTDAGRERTLVVHSQRRPHPEKWHNTSVMTDRWRLVRGTELYDMENDPGQQSNVATMHPQVVEQLTQFYDQWWSDVSQGFDQPVRMIVGAQASPVTQLTAHDWHGAEVPWDQSHIRRDEAGNGVWQLRVAEPGLYRITLRMRPGDEPYAFAAGKAQLVTGEITQEQAIDAGATAVVFETALDAGPLTLGTTIQEAGHPERGAYFVTLERL